MKHKNWDIVADDDLSKAYQVSNFLQNFVEINSDIIWSKEYFQWKLGGNNPAGPGFLTVALNEGEIIGVTTITKKRLWINGKEEIGGEIGDTYTHPSFRREGSPIKLHHSTSDKDTYVNKSIFGRLVTETIERATKSGISIIYGTPNMNSMPGYLKHLNFVEHSDYKNVNFVRLTPRAILDKLKYLSPVSNILEKTDLVLSNLLSKIYTCKIYKETGFGFEGIFNNLWNKVKKDFGFSIIRDYKWFNHRFICNPISRYDIYSVYKNSDLCGFIIIRNFSTISGKKICYIADFLIKDMNLKILRDALAQIITKEQYRDSQSFIIWLEENKYSNILKNIGFFSRKESPIIFFNSSGYRKIFREKQKLFFSFASTDNV